MDFASQYGFTLVDDSVFKADINPDMVDVPHNHCTDCGVPMTLSGNEYQCPDCGQVIQSLWDMCKDNDETVSSGIKISTGKNKGKFYNITSDYSKIQKKLILEQLSRNKLAFSGNAFSQDILEAAATQYNNIQKLITEKEVDENGTIKNQKKFVRRGNIKDEIISALIYFECIRKGIVRKKKDIAMFMRLPTHGFSRGEDILRNLHALGKIDIPVNNEPVNGYAERYLESLALDEKYLDFIKSVIETADKHKICVGSQIGSKIAGVVWIIVSTQNIKCSISDVEKACDNTKKNTFIKFTRAIYNNPLLFMKIFKNNNIKWQPC